MTNDVEAIIRKLQGWNELEIYEALLKMNELDAAEVNGNPGKWLPPLLKAAESITLSYQIKLEAIIWIMAIETASRTTITTAKSDNPIEATRLVLHNAGLLKDHLNYDNARDMINYLKENGQDVDEELACLFEKTGNPNIRDLVMFELIERKTGATALLLKMLEGCKPIETIEMIEKMVGLGTAMPTLVPALAELAKSEHTWIKRHALRAAILIEQATEWNAVQELLLANIANPDSELREFCFERIREHFPDFERNLREIVYNKNEKVGVEIGLELVIASQRRYLKMAKEAGWHPKKIEQLESEFTDFYIRVSERIRAAKKDVPLNDSALARMTVQRMEKRAKDKTPRTFSLLKAASG
jgi:uncharacterized protein YueI